MSLLHYLVLSAILFSLSLAGIIINRKNLINILLCLELVLLSINTNFIAFSYYFQALTGQIFVFFILTVAAAEAAIGLAILIVFFRRKHNIQVETMSVLKG